MSKISDPGPNWYFIDQIVKKVVKKDSLGILIKDTNAEPSSYVDPVTIHQNPD